MAEPIIHLIDHDIEADTCRKFVLPKLKNESSWTDEQIMEQRPFTAGKIIVIGRIGRRKKAKKADYLLRYTQNFLIAVVEAKRQYKTAAEGMQQAKEYAQILGLKFAYATNGKEILEVVEEFGVFTVEVSYCKKVGIKDSAQKANELLKKDKSYEQMLVERK